MQQSTEGTCRTCQRCSNPLSQTTATNDTTTNQQFLKQPTNQPKQNKTKLKQHYGTLMIGSAISGHIVSAMDKHDWPCALA
eukprot:m.111925 g.111925  ORF g.111925 m.111925 type:complete len:81 (-) comp12772_c0_seq4:5001-5243(-)